MRISLSASFLLFSIAFLYFVNADDRIKFIDGTYGDIIVAINKDLKPDNSAKFIENLKELFRHSSEFLYNATGGRAWFKNITFIVPETWPIPNAEKIPSCYSDAHIRIGHTDPVYGDDPYTLQPDECGKPGQYIHLTENFILNLKDKTTQDYGRPEKHFIHEWAHFRYGVFDEHGQRDSDAYPAFYLSEGKIHPTSCSKNISGWAEKSDGSKCSIYKDGTVDYDCEFFADKEANVEASLMYSPYLNSINHFCTHDSGSREHDKIAPNQQNEKCDGRSAWEVIMNNKDFQGQSIPAKPKTFEPDFILRKYGENNVGKYVLVLDISSSMKGSRIQSLSSAAKTFIKDIPDGNWMGIVTFSTHARIEHNLVRITDANIRQNLTRAVPVNVESGTGIGEALLTGIKVLQQGGQTLGSTIVLVTDGEENQTPNIHDVIPAVKSSGVKVMCLAVGPSASKDLERLSLETGGRMDVVTDGINAGIKIENIFASFAVCEDDEESISIFNQLIEVDLKIKMVPIPIDKELGKNTVITISVAPEHQSNFGLLTIEINSPNGTKYTCGVDKFARDDALKRCQLKLAQSEIGTYTVVIQKSSETLKIQVNVKITSQTRDPNNFPISVKAWLSKIDVNHGVDQPTIYVQVKKGSYPVINANVTAIIEADKSQFRIPVKDSGDYDGIYIAIFKKANSDGRYSVTADVTYTNTTRLVIVNKGDSRPIRPKVNDKPRVDKPKNNFGTDEFIFNETKPVKHVEVQPLEPFLRVTIAGSFKVSNYSDKHVQLEPVVDLKVAQVREDMHLIDVQWTAVDDDSYNGNVREVDMRVSKKKEDLLDENTFMKQTKVTADMIKFGEFKHFKSGTLQDVGIKLSNEFWPLNGDAKSADIYIAMRVMDTIGNKAKISNIANAHFGYNISTVPKAPTPAPGPEPISEIIEDFNINTAFLNKSFTIPEKYGVLTEWKIFAGKIENFNFTLKSPDNSLYNELSDSFTKDLSNNIARYHFEDAVHGIWELSIKYIEKIKTFDDTMTVEVISSRRKNNYF